MAGYTIISLDDILNELGEDKTKNILSTFSCPLNPDVEKFLRLKAITFERQTISKTHLIYASYKGEQVLCGYYALANKVLSLTKKHTSRNIIDKIKRYATYDDELKIYRFSAPLIGQLGKNFANGYNRLISGDELLLLACSAVRKAQSLIGGKAAYLECEDKPILTEFYSKNGFIYLDKRRLGEYEKTDQCGTHMVQMIRFHE